MDQLLKAHLQAYSALVIHTGTSNQCRLIISLQIESTHKADSVVMSKVPWEAIAQLTV